MRIIASCRHFTCLAFALIAFLPSIRAQLPVPTITSPAVNTTFAFGDTVAFAGTATDPEDGTLPPSAYTWKVDFHSSAGVQPVLAPFSGVTSGTFSLPVNAATEVSVWYTISLKVTDSNGNTKEVTRDIFPRHVSVTLATNPAGLNVTLDGAQVTAPNTFTGNEGLIRTIGTNASQTLGGTSYNFQSWSDGGETVHEIVTPRVNTTYTANFQAATTGASVLMQAESLARTSSGATTTPKADTAASGGNWIQLDGVAAGNSMTFTTSSLTAGSYDLQLKYKSFTSRGQCAVRVDGAVVGSTLDQYSAAASYPSVSVGTVNFASSGAHTVSLTVTGKNGASTGFTLSADAFTFVPLSAASSVAAPAFNPAGGITQTGPSVAISSATSGASIRYTTDGSTPTATTGLLYSGPVSITSTRTLKAIAFLSGQPDSSVTSATYTISPAAPTFSPGDSANSSPALVYTSPQAVKITSSTAGASIRYTTDGSSPTSTTGILYSAPVTVSGTTTLKAIAFVSGQTDSNVTSATYTFASSGRSAFTKIEAESYTSQVGTVLETCSDTGGGTDVASGSGGDSLVFNNIDFGSGALSVDVRYANNNTVNGSVEFRLGSTTGTLIASASITSTGGWQTWKTKSVSVSGASGLKNLFIVYKGTGGTVANLNWFQFSTNPAGNPLIPGIGPMSAVTKSYTGFVFTEGPAADAAGNTYFSDQSANKIYKIDTNGVQSLFLDNDGGVIGMMFDGAGKLIACQGALGRVVSINISTKAITVLADTFNGARFNRPNDLVIDAQGGIYFTDPIFSNMNFQNGVTGVYYIAPSTHAVTRVISSLSQPNGILLSRDGTKLYVTTNTIRQYPVTSPGVLGTGTLFADLGVTSYDGMTIDTDGNLYVTPLPNKTIQVISPTGASLGSFAVPEQPSNIEFGGVDRKTIYITAGTSVYTGQMLTTGFRYTGIVP